MGDENSNQGESFNDKVSFATLETRPEIPSFDTNSDDREGGRQWEKDTYLRLEGKRLGREDLPVTGENSNTVFIFGPERSDGSRQGAVFNTVNREKIAQTAGEEGYGFAIRQIASEGKVETGQENVVHQGDRVRIAEFDPKSFKFEHGLTLKVTSIRAGKV